MLCCLQNKFFFYYRCNLEPSKPACFWLPWTKYMMDPQLSDNKLQKWRKNRISVFTLRVKCWRKQAYGPWLCEQPTHPNRGAELCLVGFPFYNIITTTSMGGQEELSVVFTPSQKLIGTLRSMSDNTSKSCARLNYTTMLTHKLCTTSCGLRTKSIPSVWKQAEGLNTQIFPKHMRIALF